MNAAYTQWYPNTQPVQLVQTSPAWNLLMCTNFSPLLEYNVIETINLTPEGNTLGGGEKWPVSLHLAPIATDGVVLPPANHPLLQCSPGGTQLCIRACPAPKDEFYACQTDDTPVNPTDPFGPTYCKGTFGIDPVCYTMPSVPPANWPCTYTPGVDCAADPDLSGCVDAGAPPIVTGDAGAPGDGG
jgi:hypothetical protein